MSDNELNIYINMLYEVEKKSIQQICGIVHMSNRKVSKRINNVRTQGVTKVTIKLIQEFNELYDEEKMSMKEIAEIYGLHMLTVRKYIWNPRTRNTHDW